MLFEDCWIFQGERLLGLSALRFVIIFLHSGLNFANTFKGCGVRSPMVYSIVPLLLLCPTQHWE